MMNDNLYISLYERERKRKVSICPIAGGHSLKCRHGYTKREYLNKRSNNPYSIIYFLSNVLYDEHSSINNFALSACRYDRRIERRNHCSRNTHTRSQ